MFDPGEFLNKLLQAIRVLHPANLTTDDVTALLFRPNSLALRVPLSTRIKAQWLMLKELGKYVVRRREPMPWPQVSLANIGGAFSNKLAKATPGAKAASERESSAV